jgi:hypothetical protein
MTDRPEEFEDLPKHISFVPQGKGSGLQIRIWKDGETIRKFFALSHFETAEDCLFAAKAWRDLTLSELPDDYLDREISEETRRKISEARTQTGIRGFGFSVIDQRGEYRLTAQVQWQEEGRNRGRARSLHHHGIDQACNQLARSLVKNISAHENKDPSELAGRCKGALKALISRIYDLGVYPSESGNQEERYEALAEFVEESETLPVDEETLPVEGSREEGASYERKRDDLS